jgi:hypothetical protein
MRLVEAGWRANIAAGRMGRATRLPPQLGQTPLRTVSAQAAQNVHSKEQMRASGLAGGKSRSQHSQPGRNSSLSDSLRDRGSGLMLSKKRRSAKGGAAEGRRDFSPKSAIGAV